MALGPPPPPSKFKTVPLLTRAIDPATLFRISRYDSGEPFFGKSKANRFDDPSSVKSGRFGASYFGFSLDVAFAETVLHNLNPMRGLFKIPVDVLSTRFVVRFSGDPLIVADMTGHGLKRSGADGSLSSIPDYTYTQQWSRAIYKHPLNLDGFLYMSRHKNNELALVLFDRSAHKLRTPTYAQLDTVPKALKVVTDFGVAIQYI